VSVRIPSLDREGPWQSDQNRDRELLTIATISGLPSPTPGDGGPEDRDPIAA